MRAMALEHGRADRVAVCAGTALCLLLLVPAATASALFAGSERSARGPQGYLGINFRDVTDEQVAVLKLRDAHGEEVFMIDHDGPASQSGLREHDVLLQIDGQPIEGEEQLRRILHDIPAGRRLAFLISRDGQQQTLSIQLANRDTVGQEAWKRHITVTEPPAFAAPTRTFFGGKARTAADLPLAGQSAGNMLSASYTGALLELIGPQLADFFGAQTTGLLVHAVEPDSPAATAGLRAGDVVVRIDAQPVATAADWVKTVHSHRGHPVPVVILREKKEQILTLTPDTKKRSGVALPPGPQVGMLTYPGPV